MQTRPLATETTEVHTRLLKCALELDATRAWWEHADGRTPIDSQRVYEEFWFGSRSEPYTRVLITNLRARFGPWPTAHFALHHWRDMDPDTRSRIAHWHLQLTDPLYRTFSGTYLAERRERARNEVTTELTLQFVATQEPTRWTSTTRAQLAGKLLSCAHSAGILGSTRDPRPLLWPRVPAPALEYLLYLLRETSFQGTLLENPYLRSVGLYGSALTDRLRTLPNLSYQHQSGLIDLQWRYPTLADWAAHTLGATT